MGRPDIVLLLAGGDVAALTARQVTARAAEARAGSASPGGRKPAAAGGSPDGSPAASPVKALLGLDVPSAMVGSELSRLAKMSAGVPRVEAEGPADRPARPESSRGAYRLRDNLLALRAAELHTAVQRPPTAPGAGGAGEPAPLTAPAAAFAGAGAAGGGSPTRAFVRVGASAAERAF